MNDKEIKIKKMKDVPYIEGEMIYFSKEKNWDGEGVIRQIIINSSALFDLNENYNFQEEKRKIELLIYHYKYLGEGINGIIENYKARVEYANKFDYEDSDLSFRLIEINNMFIIGENFPAFIHWLFFSEDSNIVPIRDVILNYCYNIPELENKINEFKDKLKKLEIFEKQKNAGDEGKDNG